MSPALTLVAVHGNGGGAWRFERVRPFLPEEVRFTTPTLPGFGRVPRDPALASLRDYATRLRSLIADEPRPLVLLGHGIGGSLLLELAQFAPEAGDALILHAPVGARLESRLLPRLLRSRAAAAIGQRALASRLLRPLWRRRLLSTPVPRVYLDRFFGEYRSCAVFGDMFALITPEWFASLRPVPTPGALLWGERDGVLGVDQLEAFRVLLPGCLVSLPRRWDHFPMVEDPEGYAREVLALCRRLCGLPRGPHPP